ARLCFSTASRMVEANPAFKANGIRVLRNAIVVDRTGSSYKAISAEAFTKHGLSPHGVIFDELHAQPNRELWDVLTSGQGARRQPLTVAITTAGFDRQSICYELYEYGRQLEAGLIEDPTFFFRWWGAPDEADWTDRETWALANPNYPTSPKGEFLEGEFKQASLIPARQNTFRNLYLNQWVQASVRWLDLRLWDDNAGLVDEAALEGRRCWAGLDVASTSDFTALVYLFPPIGEETGWQVVCRFFLPRQAVETRSAMRPTLEVWEREGWLTVTDGDVVDDQTIKATIKRDAARFNIRTLGFDPWDARSLAQWAQDDLGLDLEKIPQSMARLSGPSKELERMLGDRLLQHGGNPILRWMADNVVLRTDGDGRIKPDKKKSSEKIDGIVALVMALGLSMTVIEEPSYALEGLSAFARKCQGCGLVQSSKVTVCARCGAELGEVKVG
ncbi:MAG TPA: terminase TerL endonuclease subunit, partial [Acidimicrobiales bacterium]|nr:terminase TerL endonuclease subunit [Acidimicrobiales bacterium]